MKVYYLFFLVLMSCASTQNTSDKKTEITFFLDNWHKAAAEANYDNYFNAMSDESIFIGTDATEN